MLNPDDALSLAADLVTAARRAGADAADAHCTADTQLSASVRLGAIEDLTRSEGGDLSLRLFIGRRVASVSASDLSAATRAGLVERAIDMARSAPEDRFAGLADPALMRREPLPDLDLADRADPDADTLIALARRCEEAARMVAGVTNSEGAGASAGRTIAARAILPAEAPLFTAVVERTSHGLSATVVAEDAQGKERDYAWHSARHFADLDAAEALGALAGERAVARLSPVKPESGVMPVVFSPRVSASLIEHFLGAISGPSIARQASFLLGKRGEQLFAANITLREDPLLPRGLRSRAVDSEGVSTTPRLLIDGGVLTGWLIDSTSGRQLGEAPTGHASGHGVSVGNVWLEPGIASPDALIADITTGLYVTELIGMGVNGVTGDYSRGASGRLIEGGALTRPVSEITIAGHLLEMFAAMVPANDLERRYGVDAPTLRIDGMTIAGN